MITRAAIVTFAFLFVAPGIDAQANNLAEQCRTQYARNQAAQVQCVRRAIAAHKPTPPAPPAPAPPLAPPLAQQQVIFGLYDRRFPGFNNGKEHLGVDFAATAGAAVLAVCDGKVVYNNTVYADIVASVLIVEHNCPQPLGLVYGYYGHVLSERLESESVSRGDIIGTIKDWAGNSHLHLGLNTQFIEDNWGLLPRFATLQEIESLGWLNPLHYLSGTHLPARAQPRRTIKPTAKLPAKPKAAKTKRK